MLWPCHQKAAKCSNRAKSERQSFVAQFVLHALQPVSPEASPQAVQSGREQKHQRLSQKTTFCSLPFLISILISDFLKITFTSLTVSSFIVVLVREQISAHEAGAFSCRQSSVKSSFSFGFAFQLCLQAFCASNRRETKR